MATKMTSSPIATQRPGRLTGIALIGAGREGVSGPEAPSSSRIPGSFSITQSWLARGTVDGHAIEGDRAGLHVPLLEDVAVGPVGHESLD